MSDAADEPAVDTTYDRFANDPAYVAANQGFVKALPLSGVTRIPDLYGGTGAVGQLLLAAAPAASLYQIDLDPVQIGLAAQNYAQLGFAFAGSTRPEPNSPRPHPGVAGSSQLDRPPTLFAQGPSTASTSPTRST